MIQVASGRPGPRVVSWGDAGPRSIGRNRLSLPRSMSKHTLVAIRYSQVRIDDLPSKRSYARHAWKNVVCTASSASNADPSMR